MTPTADEYREMDGCGLEHIVPDGPDPNPDRKPDPAIQEAMEEAAATPPSDQGGTSTRHVSINAVDEAGMMDHYKLPVQVNEACHQAITRTMLSFTLREDEWCPACLTNGACKHRSRWMRARPAGDTEGTEGTEGTEAQPTLPLLIHPDDVKFQEENAPYDASLEEDFERLDRLETGHISMDARIEELERIRKHERLADKLGKMGSAQRLTDNRLEHLGKAIDNVRKDAGDWFSTLREHGSKERKNLYEELIDVRGKHRAYAEEMLPRVETLEKSQDFAAAQLVKLEEGDDLWKPRFDAVTERLGVLVDHMGRIEETISALNELLAGTDKVDKL
jgi:hypothetical protein